jgi:GAF domain-containing protein
VPVRPVRPSPLGTGADPTAPPAGAASTARRELAPRCRPAPESHHRQLLAAGMALASELSLPALLRRVVELAAQLTGARRAALGVLGPDGALVELLTTGEAPRRGSPPRPPPSEDVDGVLAGAADCPQRTGSRSCLATAILARGELVGTLVLADKRDAPGFSLDDDGALLTFATQAGIAIANARLYEGTRRRERWLGSVREITTAILAGVASEEVLRLVTRHARELVDADVATMAIPDEAQGGMRVAVAVGNGAAELEGGPVPWDASAVDQVVRTGRPVRNRLAAPAGLGHRVVSRHATGPSLLVPFSADGTGVGILAGANPVRRRRFGDDDLQLLESFAEQATLCLAYGHAQRELRRLALVAGRQRIAEDLHDGVIQDLFAVGLGLQATAASLDGRVADRVGDALGEIDRVIGELRDYIRELPGSAAAAAGADGYRSSPRDWAAIVESSRSARSRDCATRETTER